MDFRSLLPYTSLRSGPGAEAHPFADLQREFDRLFNDLGRAWPATGADLMPVIDVAERDNCFVISAELPGMEEKDVEVTLDDDVLTIRGEKKQEKDEKGENRRVIERSYGSFSRSIRLPPGINPDDVKAAMAKGVLTVTLPKPAQAEMQARKIEVKSAA
jgi:HSP20 family protein